MIQLLHWTDKEIAQALGISPNTVKKRVKAILKRTSSTTRTEAALKFYGLPSAAVWADRAAQLARMLQRPMAQS